MQDKIDAFRFEQVNPERAQHTARRTLETNLGIAGPGARHASPWTPDIILARIRLNQPLRQTLDTRTRAGRVNSIDCFVIELGFYQRSQVTI